MSSETSINIPQLLVLLVLGFLVIRWFISKPDAANNSATAAVNARQGGNRGRAIDPRHVESVMAMFPQLDRRSVMWDLQRNGGNVAATSERVLEGRALETPPPSFQPVLPPSSIPSATSTSSAAKPQTNPDLITRYNLSSKISEQSLDKGKEVEGRGTWAATKTDRQSALQKKREEMILRARRKFQEEEEKRKAGTGS